MGHICSPAPHTAACLDYFTATESAAHNAVHTTCRLIDGALGRARQPCATAASRTFRQAPACTPFNRCEIDYPKLTLYTIGRKRSRCTLLGAAVTGCAEKPCPWCLSNNTRRATWAAPYRIWDDGIDVCIYTSSRYGMGRRTSNQNG